MGLMDEFNVIIKKEEKVVASVTIDLYAELIKITPVDKGVLKASWVAPLKITNGWIITNTQNTYGEIILGGLRTINGKTYGSKQLPLGIDPTLMKTELELQRKLKAIK